MPRKKSSTLTEAELRVMEVLWRLGRATVGEVTEALLPPPLAYNTVLTTLRILEQKGNVAHEDGAGRAFVYYPLVERDAAAQSAVKQVITKFFGNNAGALALRLIENERPSDDELSRLRSLIERYEEQP